MGQKEGGKKGFPLKKKGEGGSRWDTIEGECKERDRKIGRKRILEITIATRVVLRN
jgi:hypothetical protein